MAAKIPWPKRPQTLPDILTGEEVGQLFREIRSLKHRAILMTAYGAGLRITEACSLGVADIDSKRMLIHVREGKSSKDRYVMLSERLLDVLRVYFRGARPEGPFLFPGDIPGRPITTSAVQRVLKKAVVGCGFTKRVTPHSLRHGFATHLLEAGEDMAQRVLAIPTKRFDKKVVGYLTQEEMKAVLAATDPSTWSGRRDHAMLMTAYDTAVRVSELIGMRRADSELAPKLGTVKIHGKGRKERVVVLSPQTTAVLRRWDRDLGDGPSVLFPNRAGGTMTRSGAHARLREAVERAAETCPSLRGRRVSPHTIRHTTAMHLLQSGMNLAAIALFLGHEDVQTTHGYVEANAEMKRSTLAALPHLGRGPRTSPKQRNELIAFLESLQRDHRS